MKPRSVALGFAAAFFLAGVAFAPLLGIENDESLFGSALYAPAVAYSWQGVPLMLMSYVGTLKGLLYGWVFRLWTPGPFSIRIPVVLVGAATVWLFFLLLRRLKGDRVALIGTALLATDSLFFLTTVYDWGPVALAHLLLAGGLLLCLKFHQTPHNGTLAVAFFLFGLGLWDKALFAWVLVGLTIAALSTFPREILRLASWRRLLLAKAAFALGALPLLLYNFTHAFETFRSNTSFAPAEIAPKFVFLGESLTEGIAAWMVAAPSYVLPSPLGGALVVALLLWPLMRQDRALRFAAVFMIVVWLQMAVTINAGASAHHIVFLWPFPQLFLAVILGADWSAGKRRMALAAASLLVIWNVAVLGTYYQQLKKNGGTLIWTDAIYPLSDYMKRVPEAYVADWGILENLTLLNQGRVTLRPAWPIQQGLPLGDSMFLAHTEGNEFFRGNNAQLKALALQRGLRPEVVSTIHDSRGRPIFQVVRFR